MSVPRFLLIYSVTRLFSHLHSLVTLLLCPLRNLPDEQFVRAVMRVEVYTVRRIAQKGIRKDDVLSLNTRLRRSVYKSSTAAQRLTSTESAHRWSNVTLLNNDSFSHNVTKSTTMRPIDTTTHR